MLRGRRAADLMPEAQGSSIELLFTELPSRGRYVQKPLTTSKVGHGLLFWLFTRGFKVSSGTVEWYRYRSSYGTDFENSEIASLINGVEVSLASSPCLVPQVCIPSRSYLTLRECYLALRECWNLLKIPPVPISLHTVRASTTTSTMVPSDLHHFACVYIYSRFTS